jgi:hypothetical protein
LKKHYFSRDESRIYQDLDMASAKKD